MSEDNNQKKNNSWKRELSQRPGEKGYINNDYTAPVPNTIAKAERSRSRSRSRSKTVRFTPKYHNHSKLIQDHLDEVKHEKIAGNPRNTTHMYDALKNYEMIEKIAEDKQKVIMAEIEAHNKAFNKLGGGSRRKTRRNRA